MKDKKEKEYSDDIPKTSSNKNLLDLTFIVNEPGKTLKDRFDIFKRSKEDL